MSNEDSKPNAGKTLDQTIAPFADLNLRALFVAAFFFGLIPITVTAASKSLWTVIVFGVVFPLLFLVLYWAVGKFTYQAIERQESFADSVYYLGFLLTLASLFAALFSLRDEQHNLGMLAARFGLALLTTIIGLLIRVTIVNFERDIDDDERRARESLTKGVDQFQAEVERLSDQLQLVLSGIAQQTHDLGKETINITREQLNDLRRQSEETHKEFATTNSQLLAETSKKFNEAAILMHDSLLSTLTETSSSINAAAQGTSAVFAALQEAPKAYQKRTEQNIRTLEEAQKNLTEIVKVQNDIAMKLGEQAKVSSDITEKLNSAASNTAVTLQKFASAGDQAEAATKQISACLQTLNELGQSLKRFEDAVKRGPVELEVMLPKMRLAMNEITELSKSGEESLRQVQRNLIGATQAIVHHLGEK